MGYWMAGQVRTTRSSVTYKNKSRIGFMTLISILMIPCDIFLSIYLESIRVIGPIGSCRGRVDGRGGAL